MATKMTNNKKRNSEKHSRQKFVLGKTCGIYYRVVMPNNHYFLKIKVDELEKLR